MTMKSSSKIEIRYAGPADAVVLLDLIHAAFAEYVGQLDPPSGAPAETAASLLRLFEHGERAALATIDGTPTGGVFFAQYGVEMYAHRLAVLPGQRGRGIGQALMAYVEAQAQAAGCRYVRVAVRLALPENIDFYVRQGYAVRIASSHPGYEQPTFVHMTHELVGQRVREVIVTPYDPAWPAQFAVESRALRTELGDLAVEIHHIGSTAVPGLAAKPIIDIMPIVRNIRAVDRHIVGMARLGYVPRGEYGLPGRRYFSKETAGVHSHHVHMYERDNPEVARHLAFRNYLRANPEIAHRYGELKLNLAQAHPTAIDAYMDGKDGFIKDIELRALRWHKV